MRFIQQITLFTKTLWINENHSAQSVNLILTLHLPMEPMLIWCTRAVYRSTYFVTSHNA